MTGCYIASLFTYTHQVDYDEYHVTVMKSICVSCDMYFSIDYIKYLS